jgi:hypothetical protein
VLGLPRQLTSVFVLHGKLDTITEEKFNTYLPSL